MDDDKVYESIKSLNKAAESKIDMRVLVRSIALGFDGMEGLGREAVSLYKNVKGEGNQVRLMVEFLKSVNICTEPEEDDLPDDMELLAKAAKTALREYD